MAVKQVTMKLGEQMVDWKYKVAKLVMELGQKWVCVVRLRSVLHSSQRQLKRMLR